MKNQPHFKDIVEGQEIPALEKRINLLNLVMYHGAIWVFDRIHFDHVYATERRRLPGVIASGNMAVDYCAQLLRNWASEKGELRRLSIRYHSFMIVGDTLQCGGKVIRKFLEAGNRYIELDLWIKNQRGIDCITGKGIVEFGF